MKDKTSNVPATLDTASGIARYVPDAPLWKVTKHTSKHHSSVFGINQTKLHPTTENDFLHCQSS